MGRKCIDLTGRRFGRLVVIERAENTKNRKVKWLCRCDCGNKTLVNAGELLSEHTLSCGCIKTERWISLLNSRCNCGESKTKLYAIWTTMKQRTSNPNDRAYVNYGARGIDVCDLWKGDFQQFKKWALSHGYREDLTLDRIDNDKGYSPDNCRWTNRTVQNNNSRNCHLIEFRGQTHTLSEWAALYNLPYWVLKQRINKLKWEIERALTTPVLKR